MDRIDGNALRRAANEVLGKLVDEGLLGNEVQATVRSEGPAGVTWTRVDKLTRVYKWTCDPVEISLGFDTSSLPDPRPLNAKLVALLCVRPYVIAADAVFMDGHIRGLKHDLRNSKVPEYCLGMRCSGNATMSIPDLIRHTLLGRAAALEAALGRDAAMEVARRSMGIITP
jgi:hypothetical protein